MLLIPVDDRLGSMYSDAPTKIPQVWILRIGTGFAFAFKTILTESLSFVICQLLWFSTRRKYLTVQGINTLYSVERGDIMLTALSNAVMHGPLLVGATILSFMLPISAVFSPASLGVRATTYAEDAPCVIAASNFRNSSTDGFPRFFQGHSCSDFYDVTATVARLSEITFASGTPTPLPEFCGKNCTYKVIADSMSFKCERNVQLPQGHMGTWDPAHPGPSTMTFWNATATGDQLEPNLLIYVGWASGDYSRSVALQLERAVRHIVQTINGAQPVSYDITTFDPLPPVLMPSDAYGCRRGPVPIANGQIASITQAARRVLLGSLSVTSTTREVVWNFNSSVRLAPFLNMSTRFPDESYAWKDVVKSIEQTTANITAALLNLDDDMRNTTCSYIHCKVVYDYNPANLLAPYGAAIFVAAVALFLGVFVFLRFDPDDLTTSFVDTIGITRTQEMQRFVRGYDGQDEFDPLPRSAKFRLGAQPEGCMEFEMKQDL
ncbi:hypothetical protein M407DRAFT_28403 [Tulasnella calospora MUT 4182]|uniref:Uncharacterized protein n=1 Tax=Tulasnella calospora MUT 4182 TaxID=1051891 RepID=A0A0C3KKW1_9AGAM|nr:hypothetical protein M407DRAFT_28403 [Tulasnella calospora MUT 4182]